MPESYSHLAAAKGYSFSISPPPCLVPEEPSRARSTSSSPIDGTHGTNDTGALSNDQYATPTNYSPRATPNPGPPSLPSRIGPDDDFLNFEPDDASTPAPPQQLSRPTVTTDAVPPSRTQTPEADDHVPSSRTPSPPRRVPHLTVQTPCFVFDTQSQVTVDHDDEEVERMITAPTPSLMSIGSPGRTPQKLQLPIDRHFLLDDDEMSELSTLSSEESEAPESRSETPNPEVKQEPGSSTRRGSARKAKESSTSAPSSTKKRKKRSSAANDQPRKRRKRADAGKPRKKIVWPEKVDSDCRVSCQNSPCMKSLL
ncbi:hypothetical protein AAF712_002174 [Marasmius tenuissimus]|uniref:Uncharacterized protein n=1 Tax=Marasmius tenuissimus TaxID=585030 RepID=A0ABR3AD82_9AGAR